MCVRGGSVAGVRGMQEGIWIAGHVYVDVSAVFFRHAEKQTAARVTLALVVGLTVLVGTQMCIIIYRPFQPFQPFRIA